MPCRGPQALGACCTRGLSDAPSAKSWIVPFLFALDRKAEDLVDALAGQALRDACVRRVLCTARLRSEIKQERTSSGLAHPDCRTIAGNLFSELRSTLLSWLKRDSHVAVAQATALVNTAPSTPAAEPAAEFSARQPEARNLRAEVAMLMLHACKELELGGEHPALEALGAALALAHASGVQHAVLSVPTLAPAFKRFVGLLVASSGRHLRGLSDAVAHDEPALLLEDDWQRSLMAYLQVRSPPSLRAVLQAPAPAITPSVRPSPSTARPLQVLLFLLSAEGNQLHEDGGQNHLEPSESASTSHDRQLVRALCAGSRSPDHRGAEIRLWEQDLVQATRAALQQTMHANGSVTTLISTLLARLTAVCGRRGVLSHAATADLKITAAAAGPRTRHLDRQAPSPSRQAWHTPHAHEVIVPVRSAAAVCGAW